MQVAATLLAAAAGAAGAAAAAGATRRRINPPIASRIKRIRPAVSVRVETPF